MIWSRECWCHAVAGYLRWSLYIGNGCRWLWCRLPPPPVQDEADRYGHVRLRSCPCRAIRYLRYGRIFDALHESPLDRWYEIGNVITIVDADLEQTLSESSRYLLASQVAQAGALLYSHVQEVSSEKLISTKNYVDQSFEILHTEKKPTPSITIEKTGMI